MNETTTTPTNGVHKTARKVVSRQYRDHPDAVVTCICKVVPGYTTNTFRTATIGGRVYVKLDQGTTAALGRTTPEILAELGERAVSVKYVSNRRFYPEPDDLVHNGPFAALVDIKDIWSSHKYQMLCGHLETMTREREHARFHRLSFGKAKPPKVAKEKTLGELMAEVAFGPKPLPVAAPESVPTPTDRLPDLKARVQARLRERDEAEKNSAEASALLIKDLAAANREVDRLKAELDRLKCNVMEAVTMPTEAERQTALLLIAEELANQGGTNGIV